METKQEFIYLAISRHRIRIKKKNVLFIFVTDNLKGSGHLPSDDSLLWQKEARDKSDKSCKRAKCVGQWTSMEYHDVKANIS